MQDLSNRIYSYYIDHFAELPIEKQFHFASRLYLWEEDETCRRYLEKLRPWFTHNDSPEAALQEIVDTAPLWQAESSVNAVGIRQPYFDKYPQLRMYSRVLFRIIFLRVLYGIDTREWFYKSFPQHEVDKLATLLLADVAALRHLSTYATNFLYLYYGVIKGDSSSLDAEIFLKASNEGYDFADPSNLQLAIYFYTHCIIGQSLFYTRHLPTTQLDKFQTMLSRLDILLNKHFENINLDNKFEYLVCARLLSSNSSLASRIFNEASKSLAPDGIFLIDQHNGHPQSHKISFADSEHRNVLFIMATRPFKPLD